MSEWWDRIESIPLRVESYELTGHDREYGSFTRPSTLIHLRGLGEEGIGEDVVYDVLDHIAHRDGGAVHDFTGVTTLGEFCELVGGLDLFPVAAPGMEASRHYRRWAFESAALDLALRQAGTPFHDAIARQVELYPRYAARGGTYLHDPLAAALMVRPSLAEWSDLRVDVELGGRLAAGATLARTPSDDAPANARVALGIDGAEAERFITARLAAPLDERPPGDDPSRESVETARVAV